jgi:hypothetical protein
MAFPVPPLTFVRCADTSPAGTTIQDFLDAIYTALSAANDYRGTAKPASHAWTFTRRQVSSVTNAITCEPPAALGLIAPVVIIAGRTAVGTPTSPTMLAPDSAFNSVCMIGVNKNGGVYNSWDAALPMTSGQFSGYYRGVYSALNATATIIRCFVSQETIFVQCIGSAAVQGWMYAGALLQSYTNDTSLCSETDNRIYGMTVSGGTSSVPAAWLASASSMFSYNITAAQNHSAVFQPNTGTMWSCGTRTIYSTGGGTIPETQDNSGAFIGDIMDFGRNIGTSGANTGTRLGTLRGIYRAGNVISGRYLRSGSTDLYHYVSVDTSAVGNALMLPAVA